MMAATWFGGVILGVLIGYAIRVKGEGRRVKVETPIPDYDTNNPINGRRGEVVNICGAEFVRMN